MKYISIVALLFTLMAGTVMVEPKAMGTDDCDTKPLGMESGAIPDSSITASSIYNAGYAASSARLNLKRDGKPAAWAAKTKSVGEWIQVDLRKVTYVRGIATQGSKYENEWVTSYTILYSVDGISFKHYQRGKIFPGNSDINTVVHHDLQPAIYARYIKLFPKTWKAHPSMRMELYGCRHECEEKPLGMESGAIPDSRITASSIYSAGYAASSARLNLIRDGKPAAWAAKTKSVGEWIQVDLRKVTYVRGIATQGSKYENEWVTSYSMLYSVDGKSFKLYQGGKIFPGNSDINTVVHHDLQPAIYARYIKLFPKTWKSHPSMRMELYTDGCMENYEGEQ